jgi:hypothetical protein
MRSKILTSRLFGFSAPHRRFRGPGERQTDREGVAHTERAVDSNGAAMQGRQFARN